MSKLSDEQSAYKKQLDDWTKSLGLPQHQPDNDEVERIISFDRELLRIRSCQELAEDTVLLSQYSLFLQQKHNLCKSFLRWAEYVKNRIFGDDRTELSRLSRIAELRMTRIDYLARKIDLMCQSISGLIRTRREQ